MNNHQARFRPILGGIYIYNPECNAPGTLGLVATSDGSDRWIVSCYHVLGREDRSPAVNGEPIYQPGPLPENLVANLDLQRSDAAQDVAAARVVAGVGVVGEILGLGPVAQPRPAKVGERVLKSGYVSGITEGFVERIDSHEVYIRKPDAFPPAYEVTQAGDSGAIWVALADRAPVAMNRGDAAGDPTKALAVDILTALSTLRLKAVVAAT